MHTKCTYVCSLHCNGKKPNCQPKTRRVLPTDSPSFFIGQRIYYHSCLKGEGGETVRETNDPYADLDDLIFDEDDGGPSER